MVVECCFVIDLPDMGGRAAGEARHKVFALCEFEGTEQVGLPTLLRI